MKNTLLLTGLLAMLLSAGVFSCKKIEHSTNPTPANTKILSFTKVTTIAGATTTDNYRFFYDGQSRVSQILYTSNDSFQKNTSATFTYSNDTIYKVITLVKTNIVIERDTFITNTSHKITHAYMLNREYDYSYYGVLVSRETQIARGDSGTTISASRTYTSNNSDWLKRSFDGTLRATFADTGMQIYPVMHDTDLVLPVTVTWTSYDNLAGTAVTVYTHSDINSYSDVLSGYNLGGPIEITVMDGLGAVLRDKCVYPKDLATEEYYGVWPAQVLRPGDYLQLSSMITYGQTIYNNTHLLKSKYNKTDTTDIVYTIDANSKITQTFATTKDNQLGFVTENYKIQYMTN